MIKKYLSIFTCIAVMVVSGMAHAQDYTAATSGSGTDLDPDGVPYSSKYWQGYPSENAITLVRKPELNEDQVVLRIADAFAITGCADISNYSYNANYEEGSLKIEIGSTIVDMRDQSQYPHIQCDKSTQTPVADIVLNRSDLAAHGTEKIRLSNGNDTNVFDIMLTHDKLMLRPDPSTTDVTVRFKPLNVPGRKAPLVYWFYPIGTVLIWSPDLDAHDKAGIEKVREFAEDKGLVPLEDIIPDFKSPLADDRYQYFVDTEGKLTGDGGKLRNSAVIGQMNVEKKVYGLEKDEIRLDKVPVYAKTPGMYD